MTDIVPDSPIVELSVFGVQCAKEVDLLLRMGAENPGVIGPDGIYTWVRSDKHLIKITITRLEDAEDVEDIPAPFIGNEDLPE